LSRESEHVLFKESRFGKVFWTLDPVRVAPAGTFQKVASALATFKKSRTVLRPERLAQSVCVAFSRGEINKEEYLSSSVKKPEFVSSIRKCRHSVFIPDGGETSSA